MTPDDALVRAALPVVVTDTNRKRATTFFYTIDPTTWAPPSPPNAASPIPPATTCGSGRSPTPPRPSRRSLVELGGTVSTTLAGGPERPADRAVHAFDGDPRTSWRPTADPVGQRVTVRFDRPVPAGAVEVLVAPGEAQVTAIALSVDGARAEVTLDSRAAATGQPIRIPAGRATEVSLEITAVEGPGRAGIAEIRVGDVSVDEVLRHPHRAGRHARRRCCRPRSPLRADSGTGQDRRRRGRAGRDRHRPDHPRSRRPHLHALGDHRGSRAPPRAAAILVVVDGRPLRRPPGRGTVWSDANPSNSRPETTASPRHGRRAAPRTWIRSSSDPVLRRSHRGRPSPAHLVRRRQPFDETCQPRSKVRPALLVGAGRVEQSRMGARRRGSDLPDAVDGRRVRERLAGGTGRHEPGPRSWLRWTPQRIVWAGMAISAVTVLVALVVLHRGPTERGRVPAPRSLAPDARRPDPRVQRSWSSRRPRSSPGAGSRPDRTSLPSRSLQWRPGSRRDGQPCRSRSAPRLAVVLAEMTARPSLVFVGIGIAAASVIGDRLRASTDAMTDAPG